MKALSNTELTTFCSQFALILRSGISSLEGLSIMQEDSPKGEGQELLSGMIRTMEETGSLYEALTASEVFPPYLCSMVEIGEQSGRLDDVMASLSEHYRREDEMAKNIKSAVSYPLVMLGMMIVVIFVLIVKVLPVFNEVFQQLGTGLGGISGTILSLGNTVSRYALVFVLVAAVIAGLFLYFAFTTKGRRQIRVFARSFLPTRKLMEKIACSRFASGMYLSLSSGLDTDQSLEMVSRLVDHPVIQEKIRNIQALILEGTSFADAVSQTNMFSGIYARMVSIGYKTGAMDDVMKQISVQYDEEIDSRMSDLVAKLEPTLVAILSIIVGLILLSVMLPLMGIMSNIG
ncbi:secretion protein F [Drancourtella sp. An12]|uniref:type II secretion system F family protein n=1 Tax=Drancourtella sp. An12 TaxID=1965548 RepID=UPI000B37DF08|nr:type II secretion system F family protein [Drancourtella sp. An12]OUQ42263.1 secretion protein F [Drancourtella sp. An12]